MGPANRPKHDVVKRMLPFGALVNWQYARDRSASHENRVDKQLLADKHLQAGGAEVCLLMKDCGRDHAGRATDRSEGLLQGPMFLIMLFPSWFLAIGARMWGTIG